MGKPIHGWDQQNGTFEPTPGIGKGLMVDRETTTGRKAIMTRTFLRPRRLPVGTTVRHPRKKVVCFNCNKPGHIARECRKPTKPLGVGTVVQKGADESDFSSGRLL